MHADTKVIALREVEQRNEILNQALDKVKLEILSQKKQISKLESEKFEVSSENDRIKADLKVQ